MPYLFIFIVCVIMKRINFFERNLRLTTIVTVHHHLTFGRAGFESSQQTRMNLARMNGFDYVHLITSPQLIGYEECFRSIGFDYGSIYALDEVFMGVNATKIDKWHYQ